MTDKPDMTNYPGKTQGEKIIGQPWEEVLVERFYAGESITFVADDYGTTVEIAEMLIRDASIIKPDPPADPDLMGLVDELDLAVSWCITHDQWEVYHQRKAELWTGITALQAERDEWRIKECE